MHTSTRLGLDTIDATDAVEAYPTVNQQAMGILDAAVTITEGTASSRPSSGSYYGQTYYATDTAVYSIWNGSTWYPILIPGAWQPLTLVSGFITYSGGYTPSARLVGDYVQLKGMVQNNTGSTTTTVKQFATLPSTALYPSASGGLNLTALYDNAATTFTPIGISVYGGGQLAFYPTIVNGGGVSLDGITYTLS